MCLHTCQNSDHWVTISVDIDIKKTFSSSSVPPKHHPSHLNDRLVNTWDCKGVKDFPYSPFLPLISGTYNKPSYFRTIGKSAEMRVRKALPQI